MTKKQKARAKRKRIHVAKEWGVSKSSKLADLINDYLGARDDSDPRVTDIHPILVRTPLMQEETRVLVVFDLEDKRRSSEPYPGRERRRRVHPEIASHVEKKRNGGSNEPGTSDDRILRRRRTIQR